jgi:hypothetical protein
MAYGGSMLSNNIMVGFRHMAARRCDSPGRQRRRSECGSQRRNDRAGTGKLNNDKEMIELLLKHGAR